MRLSSAVLETPNIRNPLIVKSECPYILQSGYIDVWFFFQEANLTQRLVI